MVSLHFPYSQFRKIDSSREQFIPKTTFNWPVWGTGVWIQQLCTKDMAHEAATRQPEDGVSKCFSLLLTSVLVCFSSSDQGWGHMSTWLTHATSEQMPSSRPSCAESHCYSSCLSPANTHLSVSCANSLQKQVKQRQCSLYTTCFV